jgi:hypothetical protein
LSTFTSPTDVTAATLARSTSVNDLDAAVATAFGLLPDETRLKHGTVNYAVDSGTVNAYVVTLAQVPASYADGLWIRMRALNTSTGASTVNVNSLGVKTIKMGDGTDTVAGSIPVGIPVDMVYSSATGYFHIIGGIGQQGIPGTEVLPFTDASPHLKGSADATKLVRFEVDGLTTATTRVLTVQDKNITIAGTDDISTAITAAAASQAQMEAASSTAVFATPGRTNFHPGVAKAWLQCDAAGTVDVSYNITSITDNGAGDLTVTIATDFSGDNYVAVAVPQGGNARTTSISSKAAGSAVFYARDVADTPTDPTKWNIVFFGDQA